ncbi:zf-HC2 domain-containing protein [Streptomyces sp. NPDC026672]|uniref:zf-HC2 domain-containing protein n=1 Tax=unclassified Streptomyces TaxID=2593676 RepID=UPI0033FC6D01
MSTQQHPNDELLSAYTLGLIEPDDRSSVEVHTAECEACRMELAALREMEEALGEVPPEAFLEGPPDDGDLLLQRTLRQVRQEQAGQRRRRSFAVGLGAAASAAVLFFGGYLAAGDDGSSGLAGPAPTSSAPQAGVRVASAKDSGTDAGMTVRLTPATGWVRVNASVSGVPAGERCRLVVVSKDGAREIAASWVVPARGAAHKVPPGAARGIDGSAAVDPDQVKSVLVENEAGKRYVDVAL